MKRFILMNKDRKLAGFTCHENAVGEIQVGSLPPYITDLEKWIRNRTTIVGRKNYNKLLDAYGIYDRESFILLSRCISLNDTLWINCMDKPTSWNRINPYRQPLNKVATELALGAELIGVVLSTPSPELGTNGSFPKCWKHINNKIKLVKKGSTKAYIAQDIHSNEPFSEYYTYKIAKFYGVKSIAEVSIGYTGKTKYEVNNNIELPDVASYSTCFTDEKTGFIPIADIPDLDFENMNEVLFYMRSLGADSEKIFREMLLLDALTMNVDRHAGNYGFLIDNDTFKILGAAPIFDNNLSLTPNLSIRDKDIDEIKEDLKNLHSKTPLGNNFIEQGAKAMTLEMYHQAINKLLPVVKKKNWLIEPIHIREDEEERIGLSKLRAEYMEWLVRNQLINILTCFQQIHKKK